MPDTLTTPKPLIDFSGIGITYPGGVTALEGIDLEVRRGEFVAVVGPSGCGKSTLLRIASGLEVPTTGAVSLTTDHIGFVFQDATLLPWRDVLGNVELLAELNQVGRARRRETAMAAIGLVGLEGFEHQLPRALSGGMKMRASLARALTLDPELFLFDEPFGALDEITRWNLNDEVMRLFMVKRFAGLLITHSISEAVYLSTKVVVMSGRPGRVIDVIDNPLPMPRGADVRYTAEFTDLTGRVSAALEKGHH